MADKGRGEIISVGGGKGGVGKSIQGSRGADPYTCAKPHSALFRQDRDKYQSYR